MTSSTLKDLYDELGIAISFSGPRVSNDNLFVEYEKLYSDGTTELDCLLILNDFGD